MSSGHVTSTGRGGAGNIGPDPTVYTDGSIVREGFVGESPEGEYSTGRGGAGNIGSPSHGPQTARRLSEDIIPETALRPGDTQEVFHTGRGGEGNVHKKKYGGHTHDPSKESIGDKVKHLFGMDGKKSSDREGTPTS